MQAYRQSMLTPNLDYRLDRGQHQHDKLTDSCCADNMQTCMQSTVSATSNEDEIFTEDSIHVTTWLNGSVLAICRFINTAHYLWLQIFLFEGLLMAVVLTICRHIYRGTLGQSLRP